MIELTVAKRIVLGDLVITIYNHDENGIKEMVDLDKEQPEVTEAEKQAIVAWLLKHTEQRE